MVLIVSEFSFVRFPVRERQNSETVLGIITVSSSVLLTTGPFVGAFTLEHAIDDFTGVRGPTCELVGSSALHTSI